MNREDAQREAARRNGELTHGSRHRWFARASKDDALLLVNVAGLIGCPSIR